MLNEKNGLRFLLMFFLVGTCISKDTITPNQPLKDGQVLVSSGGTYVLGFFSPSNSIRRYVGLWYSKVSEQTIVWVVNRDDPIGNNTGLLSVDGKGNLVIFDSQKADVPLWSTNVSKSANSAGNYSAQLLESGNLVVFREDDSKVVWQGFDYPTDTLLPNMKLGVDFRTGMSWFLRSWKSREDPGSGTYSYGIDVNGSMPQLFLYKDSDPYWRGGPWNGARWTGVPGMVGTYLFNVSYVDNQDRVEIEYGVRNASVISVMKLDESSGTVERVTWHDTERKWVAFWSTPKEPCEYFAHCGAFGVCDPSIVNDFECKCLPSFEPKSKRDWYLRDGSNGCVRKRGGQVCGNGEGFVKVVGMKLPDTTKARRNMTMEMKVCKESCLRNCSCTAYASADIRGGGSGCLTWYGDLIDLREFTNGGQDVYVRVDAVELAQYLKESKSSHRRLKIIIVVVSIVAAILAFSSAYWLIRKKRRGAGQRSNQELLFSSHENSRTSHQRSPKPDEIIYDGGSETEVQLYSLTTIIKATDNFSAENKVGEGGFGSVYKGTVHDGQEIAVKRLSITSGQGIEEFKNEVRLIAKLQHRNLVRLLGYCIERDEKMLIYEYLPNKGLDCFIFDSEKKRLLDWKKRFDITLGIVRGMVYLHHDSRLKIIHRDLKASNILLDASLNPKIADFGMARIFGGDQIEETTKRVVGTYGYMSPEYAMEGHFSIKSDVFSFGVLLLEMIVGKKNSSYYKDNSVNLIGHVWDLWKKEKVLEVFDSSLVQQDPQISRCIHIGLLCVQESANLRPTMSEVAYMLCNRTPLPYPTEPAFIFSSSNKGPTNTSSTSVGANSVNDVTITMVDGR